MTPGEKYRPYNLFRGSIVPRSLGALTDVSAGAKLLFAVLDGIYGSGSKCNPSIEYLAEARGVAEDCVGRWLAELSTKGLIRSIRRGPGATAEREFIWRTCLAGSLKAETAEIQIQHESETVDSRILKSQKSGSQNESAREDRTPLVAKAGCGVSDHMSITAELSRKPAPRKAGGA